MTGGDRPTDTCPVRAQEQRRENGRFVVGACLAVDLW